MTMSKSDIIRAWMERNDYTDMNSLEIARAVIDSHNGLSKDDERSIGAIVRRMINQGTTAKAQLKEVDSGDPKGRTYSIDDEDYHFVIDGHKKSLSRDAVSDLHWWYCHRGMGLTQSQTATLLLEHHRVHLSDDWMKKIIGTLSLNKADTPFAPHTLAKYTNDELDKIELTRKKSERQIYERAQQAKQWKKLYTDEAKSRSLVTNLIEDLGGLPDATWHINVEPVRPPAARVEPYTLCAILSDWHIGKAFEASYNRYGIDVFKERLDRTLYEIEEYISLNRRPLEAVQICFLGDVLDGVSGSMHRHQAAHQDVLGADQIREAAIAMARAVGHMKTIADVPTRVDCVTGNHDRFSDFKGDDPNRGAGIAAYEWAADKTRGLGVDWTIHRDTRAHVKCSGTSLILRHGDEGSSKPKDIVWDWRNESDYFVILEGHYHSQKIQVNEDSNIWRVRCGAMVGTDPYAKKLGVGAQPSQAIMEIRESGPRPVIYLPVG